MKPQQYSLPLFPDILERKVCSSCGRSKPLTEFHKWQASPDGRISRCKQCKSQYDKARYKTDPEPAKERARKYRQTARGKEVRRRSNRKYARSAKGKLSQIRHRQTRTFKNTRKKYLSDPEVKRRDNESKRKYTKSPKGKQTQRRYAKTEKAKACKKRWYKSRPHYMRLTNLRRRARKRSVPGNFTETDLELMYEHQKETCIFHGVNPECNGDLSVGFHIDHIIPLSRPELNPSHWPENIQLLCPVCNIAKHNKTNDEFLDWLKEIA